MTIILTAEEKTNIINSHKRSLLYSKYNLELDLLQENAKTSPDNTVISNINSQMLESQKQILALDEELDSIIEE